MARLFYKDKPIIGLDISQTGMKVMSVDSKKWIVNGYGSIDLDPTKVLESLDKENSSEYLTNSLRSLLKDNVVGKLASNHVVIGVPASRTFTRTFTIPTAAEKTLREAVELEVEQYIPIPMSSLYVDYEIIERSKEQLLVLMCAVPRVVADSCIQACESVGLVPCMIEPSISASARLLEKTEEGHLPTVIVDIGPASTDIAILDNTIRVSGSLGIGGNTFTLDIAKRLKVTLESAHQLKVLSGLNAGSRQQKIQTALSPSLDRILAETRKVIRYYDERIEGHRKLEQVLIVGGGANVPGIGEFFTNQLIMPTRVASPWQRLDFGQLPQPAKQFRSRYITVAGLASVPHDRIWS